MFSVDQKMMKIMPILPIYSSTFGQMGMGLPPPSTIFMIIETSDNRLCELRYETIFTHITYRDLFQNRRYAVFCYHVFCHVAVMS